MPSPSPSLTEEPSNSTVYKARLIGDYIFEHLAEHKGKDDGGSPLMVAMHGPQGCGKTTVTDEIQRYLLFSKAKARCAILSLDDLYHRHESLLGLSLQHPHNKLLSGRGLPGTHDLDLAQATLDTVLHCNTSDSTTLELPVFDKSLHSGQGDRSERTVPVTNPIDVFILEGWSMGFQPIGATELTRRYNDALSSHASPRPAFLDHSLESLIQVDSYLSTAAQTLYPPFQVLIQIRPESYDYVYEWRKEQEHAMIARRGAGMTDEQVEAFVRRYMPGYELWSDNGDAWRGRSLVLWFGRGRDVVKTERL